MPTGFETKTLFDGEKDPMPPLKPPGDKPSRGEGESEEKKPKKEKKPPKAKTPEQEGKNVPWQLSWMVGLMVNISNKLYTIYIYIYIYSLSIDKHNYQSIYL